MAVFSRKISPPVISIFVFVYCRKKTGIYVDPISERIPDGAPFVTLGRIHLRFSAPERPPGRGFPEHIHRAGGVLVVFPQALPRHGLRSGCGAGPRHGSVYILSGGVFRLWGFTPILCNSDLLRVFRFRRHIRVTLFPCGERSTCVFDITSFLGNTAFQMFISFGWSLIPAIGSVRLRVKKTNHLLVVWFGYRFKPEEGPVRVSPTIEGHRAIRHPLHWRWIRMGRIAVELITPKVSERHFLWG